jgi:hypothetical protein
MFTPSLRAVSASVWNVSLWHGKHLALTLDASPLSDRFVVLAIRVVYRGIGLPVCPPERNRRGGGNGCA